MGSLFGLVPFIWCAIHSFHLVAFVSNQIYLTGQDLVHLQVLGQHIMIVNSREMARELFEKRSLIYSDRPYVPMIDLCVIKPFTLILVLNGHVRMGWLDNGFGKIHIVLVG